MSDLSEKLDAIEEAAVDVAATAIHTHQWGDDMENRPQLTKELYRGRARAALEAANLPLLALVRDQAAKLARVEAIGNIEGVSGDAAKFALGYNEALRQARAAIGDKA